jgi:hypothetical protein
MSNPFDDRSFRRLAVAAAMVVGPPVLLLTEIVHPEPSSEPAELFAIATDNASRWYLAHALALIALAAAIPIVMGLMHLLRATRPGWGNAGATIALLGLVPLAALVGTEFVVWQATGVDSPAMVQLLERLNESPGIFLVVLFALLFPIGFAVLGVGLYLARVVPRWQAAVLAISMPVLFVGDFAPAKILTLIGGALFVVSVVPLGWRLLTQTDDEWEATSRGEFRPASA